MHEDYCLYVHELAGGLRSKQLLPPDYPPPFYRERDWYQNPQRSKGPWWSEPYKRQGADDTPMVTYSVPFSRDGTFAGVVAADLSIEYFRDLRHRLQEQFLGENSYSFILSPNGTFVYHPNPKYAFPAATSSLDRIQTAPDFRALVERMRRDATGWESATDFETGRPATFCFARIPATGGHFVIVHPAPPPGNAPDLE